MDNNLKKSDIGFVWLVQGLKYQFLLILQLYIGSCLQFYYLNISWQIIFLFLVRYSLVFLNVELIYSVIYLLDICMNLKCN